MKLSNQIASKYDRGPTPALPKVTIIIINYNYGSFLRDCFKSVEMQTYPNIECVIVDNASTDGSSEILDEFAISSPDCIIIRRPNNGGQSLAAFEGLRKSSGEYVIFLDADDFLLPRAVETHIYSHLSLRIAVGFTCGDILQCADDRAVTSTSPGFSTFVTSGKGKSRDLVRPIDIVAPPLWTLDHGAPISACDLHYQKPPSIGWWIWSPMSANCFRRDALDLIVPVDDGEISAVSGTDAYIINGLGSLIGSVLIDRPLAVYRLHGNNIFSKHPYLDKIKPFNAQSENTNTFSATRAIIDHFVANADAICARLHDKYDLLRALSVLDTLLPMNKKTKGESSSHTVRKIRVNTPTFDRLFGRRVTAAWIWGFWLPKWLVLFLCGARM